MITVIIITEDVSSFNYSQGRLTTYQYTGSKPPVYSIHHELTGITHGCVSDNNSPIYENTLEVFSCDNEQLRNKVLELLHEEVAECFRYNLNSGNYPQEVPALEQINFQIYLKDIIEKARKELK